MKGKVQVFGKIELLSRAKFMVEKAIVQERQKEKEMYFLTKFIAFAFEAVVWIWS